MATPAPDDHYLDPRYDPRPSPSPSLARYQLEDEGALSHDDRTGDIPLLATHRSGYGNNSMPGGFRESQPSLEEENNIHYGRIPQRVPRRFKTTKKIQLRIPCIFELKSSRTLTEFAAFFSC
jgi:chitin synthase